MSEQKKNRLVPELRFPEFRDAGEWEKKQLSELLFETKHRNRKQKYGPQDVLSVSGEYGCVNQIEFMGRSYAGASVENYHIVEPGDIVYTKSPLKKNPYGIIKENKGKPGIVSTLYAVYRVTDLAHPAFLHHYFSNDFNLNSYLQPIVNKGAKNDMKVKNSYVLSGEIPAPKKEEQQKIADCLTSVDELITDQTQILEALKTHKKGLMRQLFPAEGETVPKRRFPEFRDAGEWIEMTLGEITDFLSGGTPSKDRPEYWDGNIPWISASSMHDTCIDSSDQQITQLAVNEGASIAPKGTILLLVRGSMLHKRIPVGIAETEVAFNQDVKALDLKINIREIFLLYLLVSSERRLLRAVTKTGIGAGKLDTNDLKDFLVRVPNKSEEEQQKIADCLASVDQLITAHAKKFEALKAHKKGLMQQLFPAMDEVSA